MIVLSLILLLGICVRVTIESQDCTNAAGYCYYSGSYLQCYINNNDNQSIKELLNTCASNSASFYYIYVYKNYVSNEYANLLVDIELPSNIQSLNIYNNEDQDHIRLTTSSQNAGLTSIYTNAYIELESNDFFTYFTGLKYIYMRWYIYSLILHFDWMLLNGCDPDLHYCKCSKIEYWKVIRCQLVDSHIRLKRSFYRRKYNRMMRYY